MRVLLLGMALAALSLGQIRTGPAVGSEIPKFEAQDQNGRLRTFDGIAGPKGALLVFFRSADW
jgi:LDH2 family malate/lactate/ureidoglycolate dehydrogenase